MSVDRSALPLEAVENRPVASSSGGWRTLRRRYVDSVRVWFRKAMAPGGVTGLFMALIIVLATDAFLLIMRRIQELPPVALTYTIPIVVAAIRWGTLSAIVAAIGGTVTLTYFFYSPFYSFSYEDRSRVLGIMVFLVVALVLAYLAARTRRAAARALERENEIRDLYPFSQRISAAHSPAAIFEAMQQHLAMLVGRKVLLFDSMGILEAKSERLGEEDIPKAVTDAVARKQPSGANAANGVVVEDERGNDWLVRPV